MAGSMTRNKTLVFKRVPSGRPVPGQDLVVEDRPIDLSAPPPDGAVLAQVLASSYDPYQRTRLRDASAVIKGYRDAYPLDGALNNAAVVRVVASSHPRFSRGDVVRVPVADMAEYATIPKAVLEAVDTFSVDLQGDVEPAHYLGVLGMPGLTAYAMLYEIGKPKKGETVFVSSAAGAVGNLVGQLAKREGCRVVGSVGSDEKVRWVTAELGFDAAFNYKKESPGHALDRLAPEGIDIYFENVGGDHFEAAMERMNVFGRIPVCGMISNYNKKAGESVGVLKDPFLLISRQLTIRGSQVDALRKQYFQEHREVVLKGLADGSVKAQNWVTDGIDHAAEGLVGMLNGENLGKAVLKISD